ncbi:MAG: threonine--tRNA ligase [bacterium]|nr:threonine--tRNA ligase [bacterium]
MDKHTKTEDEMHEVRHSLSHLLAAVVLKKYPGTKVGIGPVIENGFYYDFLLPAPISDADLLDLQKEMRHLIAQKLDFTKEEITAAKAKKLFAGQNFKLELIEELEEAKSLISLYHTSDIFTDLCKGPHVKNTSEINMEGFKLTHIAGAYWKGSEKNPMLTRIYGLAFANKKELDAHLLMLLEAKKRDHRLLGEKLKIFAFSDFVGPGLPLWLPNGTVIIEELERMAKEMERRGGYKRVRTPHIAKEIMYKTSGHLPYYADLMFPPMVMDEDGNKTTYYLKGMNCPHHHMIFANEPKSYRDLPLRLAEYGTCYRYEKSGELLGLMRVRMLSMNDAHIYCTEEQFAGEFMAVIKMYLEYFKIFGIDKYVMRFSTHSKEGLGKKYIDNEKLWIKTEDMVRDIMEKEKIPFVEVPNEAAFYGPKIDVQIWSAIGKEFTLATNQVDFAVPERFGLKYKDSDGKEKTPICIHRAPLSTHERLVGFLIEHYAGAFPTWLAPIQAMILPISEKHKKYSDEVLKELIKQGIRAEIDESNETLGKRIRTSEMQKIPYILVVGEQEETNKTVAVRQREKGPTAQAENQGAMTTEAFAEMIKKQLPY